MISRIGSYKHVLQMMRRKKMSWFGHLSRHDTFENTILQYRVDVTRKRDRPKRNWVYDIYEWIGMPTRSLLDVTKYRYSWKKLCMTPYHVAPTTSRHGTSILFN